MQSASGLKALSNKNLIIFVLVLSMCFGCSTNKAFWDDGQLEALPASPRTPAEYNIQQGDQLDVKFYFNPELNESVSVRPDGRISLQLIGDITARGLTSTQLGSAIAKAYSQELRQPEVTVIVKSFANQQVYVGGEVEREGPVDLSGGLNAFQAVIRAGGFKETAKPEAAILIRKGPDGRPLVYRIDLEEAVDQPFKAEVQLQPFDIVYVPKTFIAEADKFIDQYIQKLTLFRGWGFTFGSARFFF
jgi:protein involved in polysaccharide export with SLBB domain